MPKMSLSMRINPTPERCAKSSCSRLKSLLNAEKQGHVSRSISILLVFVKILSSHQTMIGPSSCTGGSTESTLERRQGSKRHTLEELDIDSLCEDVCQGKRYLQTPLEELAGQLLVDSTEECPVTRLEVLLVDGTTWAEQGQNILGMDTSNTCRISQETQFSHGRNFPQRQELDDQETGNLSWLLDFRLDPFIEAADGKSTIGTTPKEVQGSKTKLNGRSFGSTMCTYDIKRNCSVEHEASRLYQDNVSSYSSMDVRNVTSSRCNGLKKPPFTYTELIEHALRERGELTVSAIYQWISEHFPYYKSNDDRWKNSVRHNLSINPHFRKGSKAPHGAGHLWAIANRIDCRPQQIVGNLQEAKPLEEKSAEPVTLLNEVEAATASIIQHCDEENEGLVASTTLEHCAEQILNGVKREVEVQYIVPMMMTSEDQERSTVVQQQLQCGIKESDFLNPVSKEVVAQECGLLSEGYLVTDLNPMALGLNMIEPEIINPENLFGEELSFQFYELTSASQLQST
ncbi:hypothetical protein KM043_008049 [Ampulex compressa]|nr:hypothetical protein KM043_008049 [Ampulex compressa]